MAAKAACVWGGRSRYALSVLCNIVRRDGLLLVKLSAVLGGDAQLLARAEQTLGELAVVCGVVAVQEGLVAALHHEAGNVHGGGGVFGPEGAQAEMLRRAVGLCAVGLAVG